MKTMMNTVRDQVVLSLRRRQERAQLRRELAMYATQAEIDDLLAVFAHDESDAAVEVREMLIANRFHDARARFAA